MDYNTKEKLIRASLNALSEVRDSKSFIKKRTSIVRALATLRQFVISSKNLEITEKFEIFNRKAEQFILKRELEILQIKEESDDEEEEEEKEKESEEEEVKVEDDKNNIKMAAKINLSLAIKLVEKYDGDAAKLETWLADVDTLRADDENVTEEHFLTFLRSRLIGPARGSIDNVPTIILAKETLRNRFAIKLTPKAVEEEMRTLKQSGKSIGDFGDAMDKLASKLATAYVSQGPPFTTETSAGPVVQPKAVDSFINGLKNQSAAYMVRSRNPKTLTEAISHALEVTPHTNNETALWAQNYQPPFLNRNQGNNYRGRFNSNRSRGRGRGNFNGRNNQNRNFNNGNRYNNNNNNRYNNGNGNNYGNNNGNNYGNNNGNNNGNGNRNNNNNNRNNNNSNNNRNNGRQNANVAQEEPQPQQQNEEAHIQQFFRRQL